LLEGLAGLLGCHTDLASMLPDRKRPDVFRVNRQRKILFLGEAKDSEPPSDLSARARMGAYLRWTSIHASRCDSTTIVAVCHGQYDHRVGWASALAEGLLDQPILGWTVRSAVLQKGNVLVWAEIWPRQLRQVVVQ